MNPKLTKNQQRTICSQIGKVRLQLLFKATTDGFTGAAFHQRCDNRGRTVSVGYNASGYVFGGYTKQPFSQSGQYAPDDQAFLFTFSGEKLLKYPVTNPTNAVKMISASGPCFAETFILINGNQPVVYTNPGNYYNFTAAEMHGNDLKLTECEVYQVEAIPEFEEEWRPEKKPSMNPRLTKKQQRTICSKMGSVKLQLLFKASIHGFPSEAFHQRCDNRGRTVSVGFNASGYVFGGYTKQPFSQSGQYATDEEAFLFTFRGERLLKYPATNPLCAVKMIRNSGPYFGQDFVLLNGNQPVVYTDPGKYYNFIAAAMHGNDLKLTECEVYQVEETTELEKPWRIVKWESKQLEELKERIKKHRPSVLSVSTVQVLLIGPVGAGKSSFFNSIKSVFKGQITSQAMAGSCDTSLTKHFRTYTVKDEGDRKPLPIVFCDTMGLEDKTGAGLNIDDISNILHGHLPDRYQFSPSAPLHSESHGFKKRAELKDKIHCVAYVIDACKVSIMPTNLEEELKTIRARVNFLGIPQLALVTKVDEACPLVSEDVTNVYKSGYIRQMMQEVGALLGLPLSNVLPVKNYSEELDVNQNCDILLLSAVNQMLNLTDDYFDDISD